MKRKTTLRRTRRIIKKAKTGIFRLGPKLKAKPIHEWRLAIRKTKSVLQLQENTHPPCHLARLPNSVLRLYHLLGNIRDTQVLRTRVMDVPATGDHSFRDKFMIRLGTKLQQYNTTFVNEVERWRFSRHQLEQFMYKLQKSLTTTGIKNFLTNQSLELRELTSDPEPNDEQLHRIRAIVKDFLHNWSLLRRHAGHRFVLEETNKKSFQKIDALVGEYLELSRSIARLQRFAAEEHPYLQENTSPMFVKQWQAESKIVRDQISFYLPALSLRTGKKVEEFVAPGPGLLRYCLAEDR